MEEKLKDLFKSWAILELMGHRRLAGLVSEETLFGTTLLRIDTPRGDQGFVTQYYGGSSIYCLTPTTEEVARLTARNCQPTPVYPYELRTERQLPLSHPEQPYPDSEMDEEYDRDPDDEDDDPDPDQDPAESN